MNESGRGREKVRAVIDTSVFVDDAGVVELAQGRVVILDRLVHGLEFQPLHGRVLHQQGVDGNAGVGVKSEGPCAAGAALFPPPLWGDQAPDGAPALAVCPFPAFRRPT